MRRPRCVPVWMLAAAACGGGSTQPVPPPPPPPPPPPIGARLQLTPGEVRVLSDAASIRAFVVEGTAAATEYHVIVMSGSRVEDGATAVRFDAAPEGGQASVAPHRRTDLARTILPGAGRRSVGLWGPEAGRSAWERLERAMDPATLAARTRAGPRRASRIGTASAASVVVPVVGETLTFTSNLDQVVGGLDPCFNGTPIDGVVRSVGGAFALVEHTAAAGHFTTADYDDLLAAIEGLVDIVDHAYFGDSADLDGNGRIIVFLSWEPNRAGVPYGGFVNAVDYADPGTCTNSNDAEILWLSAPDPDGVAGPVAAEIDRLKRGLPSIVAHEYQHLLNLGRRWVFGSGSYGDGTAEDIWLNEGMSHIAEEVTGLYALGGSTRANYGYSEVLALDPDPLAFNVFLGLNFFRAILYLESPASISSLTSQSLRDDPGGVRAWAYLLLRWMADRYAAASPPGVLPGSAEDAFFRELTTGGPIHLTGVDNILRAINVVSGETPTWDDVLSQYFAAPAVDDAHPSLPSDVQLRTWNLPRLYNELGANPNFSGEYPLMPVPVPSGGSSTLTFDLGASTAQYFRLHADGASQDMLVELTTPSGTNVPSSARARVIVVRTR